MIRHATREATRANQEFELRVLQQPLANGDRAKAREHFEKSEKLINETGYHRRDKQLEELRGQLVN